MDVFDLASALFFCAMLFVKRATGWPLCVDTFITVPKYFYTGANSCYYGYGAIAKHAFAKAECETFGAHLLFLETAIERFEVTSGFPSYFKDVWLGAEKIGNVWKWVDGAIQTDANTNFQSGQEKDFSATVDLTTSDKWMGRDSSSWHRIICEKKRGTGDFLKRRYTPKDTRNVLTMSDGVSPTDCAMQCRRSEPCIGIIYHHADGLCKQLEQSSPSGVLDECVDSEALICYDKV